VTCRHPLALACVAAVAAAVLAPSPVDAVSGRSASEGTTQVGRAPQAATPPGAARFTGADGLLYESAPPVMPGLDGQLFYGADFDVACGLSSRMRVAMDRLAKLAAIIQRSGRKVVYTVGPDKSSVLTSEVDAATLPHGSCDSLGLKAQRHLLDHYPDPSYLPLRRKLERDTRQTYLVTDLHWSTVGASIFAKALATRLDPRLGREQRYQYGTTTFVGGLNGALGINQPETAQTATPAGRVEVRPSLTSPQVAGLESFYDHRWRSRPAALTFPGRTVVLGDSYMAFALDNVRPIFRQGRFLWVGHVDLDSVIRAIKDADTVVFEYVQVFLASYPLSSETFLRDLRRALR